MSDVETPAATSGRGARSDADEQRERDPPHRGSRQALPDQGRGVQAHRRAGAGRRRRRPDGADRRDARDRRRVGVRQDDARPHDHQAARAHGRQDRLRGQGHHQPEAPPDAAGSSRSPDRVPGPVRVAQPADDGARHRLRAAADPRPLPPPGGPRSRRGAPPHGRPEPGAREPLPARVLGRPATANRSRACARPQPVDDRARRAGLGARRLDPGAGREPARPAPERLRADLPLHRARPVGRAPHLRPRRGDVPREDRRDRDAAARSTRCRCIRTRRRSCRRFRSSLRPSAASALASCSRATFRAPRIRRPDVASGRAAGRRRRSAPRRIHRSWCAPAASILWPATSPRSCGRSTSSGMAAPQQPVAPTG